MTTYTITKIKTFTGMEGYGLNATICRDGKPVAFVLDDARGGDMDISFRNPLQTPASFKASAATWQQEEQDAHAWALDWFRNAPEAESCRATRAELQSEFPATARELTGAEALEDWINTTADAMELAKKQAAQLKRWSKTQTLFRINGDKAGEYRTMSAPISNPNVVPAILKKYPLEQVEMIYGVDLSTLKGCAQ